MIDGYPNNLVLTRILDWLRAKLKRVERDRVASVRCKACQSCSRRHDLLIVSLLKILRRIEARQGTVRGKRRLNPRLQGDIPCEAVHQRCEL